jgi:hypothetical protein
MAGERVTTIFRRLFTTPYEPEPEFRQFLSRAETQDGPVAQVTAAVADAVESERIFGVPLARRGLQPVFLRIINHSDRSLRLHLVSIDPNYYTPLEAAALNHFSIGKRLSAFGILAWWALLPVLALIPFKLITAYRANRRMDECFQSQAFHLRPIPPGGTSEGFVFTALDLGTKVVHVRLLATGAGFGAAGSAPTSEQAVRLLAAMNADQHRVAAGGATAGPGAGGAGAGAAVDLTFSIAVPGITADHLRRDFQTLIAAASVVDCELSTLIEHLGGMPVATANAAQSGSGDPVNLVVIGHFEMLLSAFLGRWDESETITLATCWKTVRSFLLGSRYRYSPVSPLYLFGRSQDIALQRSRRSINERLHLRLWLTPLCFRKNPVWVGKISRDIGVRFTTKTWNLTTHRIDPDVDESRDYVLEDLMQAQRIEAAGYVDGVGACDRAQARRNLTGDPYYTDGKRVVILLSTQRMTPRFVLL